MRIWHFIMLTLGMLTARVYFVIYSSSSFELPSSRFLMVDTGSHRGYSLGQDGADDEIERYKNKFTCLLPRRPVPKLFNLFQYERMHASRLIVPMKCHCSYRLTPRHRHRPQLCRFVIADAVSRFNAYAHFYFTTDA